MLGNNQQPSTSHSGKTSHDCDPEMITQLPLTGPFPFSHSSVPNDRCMHHAHRRRESEENVAFPLKEIFLPRCLHCIDTSPLGPTKPRPSYGPQGRFESLYPTIYPSASEESLPDIHPIGFRPDTFVTPIDRVRRGAFLPFVNRITVG